MPDKPDACQFSICCCQRRLRSARLILIPPSVDEEISVGNFANRI